MPTRARHISSSVPSPQVMSRGETAGLRGYPRNAGAGEAHLGAGRHLDGLIVLIRPLPVEVPVVDGDHLLRALTRALHFELDGGAEQVHMGIDGDGGEVK